MKEANARLEASRTRKYRFTLRLNDDEKAAFEAGTASSGLCPTEYLRRRATLKPIVANGYLELRAEVRRFGGLTKHLAGNPVNAEIRAELNGIKDALTELHERISETPSQELDVEEAGA